MDEFQPVRVIIPTFDYQNETIFNGGTILASNPTHNTVEEKPWVKECPEESINSDFCKLYKLGSKVTLTAVGEDLYPSPGVVLRSHFSGWDPPVNCKEIISPNNNCTFTVGGAKGMKAIFSATPSEEPNDFNDFSHGGTTFGTIIDRGDQSLFIEDLPYPDGVLVYAEQNGGAKPATVSVCGGTAKADVMNINAGDSWDPKCGSVTITVSNGEVSVEYPEYPFGEIPPTVNLSAGNTLIFEPDEDTFTTPPNNAGSVMVQQDDHKLVLNPGETKSLNQLPIAEAGPPQTVECTGPDGATVTLDAARSSDPENDPLTYSWTGPFGLVQGATPSVTLPIGSHEITLVADDGRGGSDSDTVMITVEDSQAPTISSLTADPNQLWPPNNKMVLARISVDVSDICDTDPTCRIVGVTSNEPEQANKGDKAPDWEITGPLTVNLRAERDGKGTGRVYSIEVECLDAAKNRTRKTVEVSVPHDQGNNGQKASKKKK